MQWRCLSGQTRRDASWVTPRLPAPPVAPPDAPSLELRDVSDVFQTLAGISGKGAAGDRASPRDTFFARATVTNSSFFSVCSTASCGRAHSRRARAVARASDVAADRVRRAALTGDLGHVAKVAPAATRPSRIRVAAHAASRACSRTGARASATRSPISATPWSIPLDGARIQRTRPARYSHLLAVAPRRDHVARGSSPSCALPARDLVLDGRRSRSSPAAPAVPSRSRCSGSAEGGHVLAALR